MFLFVQEHKLLRNQSICSSKLPDLNETAEQDQGATRDPEISSSYVNVHNMQLYANTRRWQCMSLCALACLGESFQYKKYAFIRILYILLLSDHSSSTKVSAADEELKEKADAMPNISDIMLRKLKLHRGLPGW